MLSANWIGRAPARQLEWRLEQRAASRMRDDVPDSLLVCEHDPVFTYHRDQDLSSIRDSLWFDFYCTKDGIDVRRTNRGGGMMYHGPGQLILAPVIKLRKGLDVSTYAAGLEETMICLLGDVFGLEGFRVRYDRERSIWTNDAGEVLDLFDGERHEGTNGVWVRDAGEIRKIGFLGSRVQRGVATHGCALNISPDHEAFSLIDPCNLPGINVSSVYRLTGRSVPIDRKLGRRAVEIFAEVFGYNEIFFDTTFSFSPREKK